MDHDPLRPRYHFHPPHGWMNDPNGTIKVGEWFHLFYQHNPFADTWGDIHWGHARSRDLLHWEHLPIALAPRSELGERHCYSGCCVRGSDGTPLIFYTSVGDNNLAVGTPAQRFAIGSPDLNTWHRPGDAVLLDASVHPGLRLGEWRDPFVFDHGGRTFMLLGGVILPGSDEAPGPAVLLYESTDPTLRQWRYGSVLFRHPDATLRSVECPNFAKIGDRWLLLCSNWERVEYFSGAFDADAGTFTPETHGRVDESGNFYATNLYHDSNGRLVMVGWLRGFPRGRGWAGCLSLPRELRLAADGTLLQSPIREWDDLPRERASPAELPAVADVRIGVPLCGGKFAILGSDGQEMTRYPIEPGATGSVRLIIDHSTLEIFDGTTHRCTTRVFHRPLTGGRLVGQGLGIEVVRVGATLTPPPVPT